MEKRNSKLIVVKHIAAWIKICFILFFLLYMCFNTLVNAQSILIWPIEISFNYEEGHSNDALTIRENGSTEITAPEYLKEGGMVVKNENCAYIKNQTNRKVKVKFYSNTSNMNFLVKATVISGEGMGNVCESFVGACDVNTNEVTLCLSDAMSGSIGKRTFTWKWEATALPINSPYCPITCQTVNTEHTFYTLIATPQAPIEEPWTSVLDLACAWAYGKTSEEGVANEITDYLYDCGFKYDTIDGSPRYKINPNKFNLQLIISDLTNPAGTMVNCLDMAWAVVTFCNALGTKLYYSKFEPIDDGSFRYNSIDPIGTPPPINNVWTEPFRNDCRSGYFYYHAFAQNNINEVWSVWDATLKYDMDSDPDNVINSNPGCGTMTSGHSWVLPCNVLELTYIQHLVDDWCKDQGESHIWDCGSDRLGCGQFYRAIEFVIYDNN